MPAEAMERPPHIITTPLPLTPGSRLGVYAITAQIGEGGMGQVYRARDGKLDRDVAIKILSEAFRQDVDRLARLQREARVLASLNHPNIAAVYGLEESGGVTALVMELVEGEDLSQRIARGAIPLDEALPIARQIADALETAHEQGIVHRDLKPANIKVRGDGTVKVLDFGLAKAMDPAASSADAMNSPTLTARASHLGVMLGTAAYMAPEQARGKVVDKRADIWAFGVVVYETLAGRRAFAGDDISDVLAAVLRQDIDWAALPPNTPPRVRRLLERCLDRDPKTRLRDIGEARVALAGPVNVPPEPAATSPIAAPNHSSRLSLALLAAGIVLGVVGALLTEPLWRPGRAASDGAVSVRFQLKLPEDVTQAGTPTGGSLGVSPDGRSFVFVAQSKAGIQLWLRPLSADAAKPLVGTEDGFLPFWSPDGAYVAFFTPSGLKRVEVATGTVSSICSVAMPLKGNDRSGGTWGADNVIVFGTGSVGDVLYRVAASGGMPTPLTTLDTAAGETGHTHPSFLPDGHRYLFVSVGTKSVGLYAGDIGSRERTLVEELPAFDLSAFEYTRPGYLVYVSNHRLVARPFDESALRFTGEAVPIADGFGIGSPGTPPFSVSGDGVLAFRPVGVYPQMQPTWFGRTGAPLGTVGMRGPYRAFDLSPDGRTLAVDTFSEKQQSVWAIDVERGTASRITSDAYSFNPHWLPSGDGLAYDSVRDTPPNPFLRTLAGVESRLMRRSENWPIESVSPDGRWLLMKNRFDLFLLATSGEGQPEAFLVTPFDKREAQIAPTGGFVAYASDESGAPEIYVTTFPKAGRRIRVSTAGGTAPRWSGDGAELYFQSGRAVMVVSVTPDSAEPVGLRLGLPHRLFDLPPNAAAWLPAKDGQRFLVDVQVADAVAAPTTVMLNWVAGLKK